VGIYVVRGHSRGRIHKIYKHCNAGYVWWLKPEITETLPYPSLLNANHIVSVLSYVCKHNLMNYYEFEYGKNRVWLARVRVVLCHKLNGAILFIQKPLEFFAIAQKG
jgi:hypothetical protein